jgi:4-hydroxybenzoyl-CoA reductase subunit beta
MTPFLLRRPSSAAQAVAWLSANPRARALAGGSDLLPNLRHGLGTPDELIDLSGLHELARIERVGDDWVIGAGVTLQTLASCDALRLALPALTQAAASVAGPGHRHVATLGGNLCLDTRCVFYNQSQWWRQSNDFCLKYGGEVCHVAPQGQRCHAAWSGDLAPALMALTASVDVLGAQGLRQLPLTDLYQEDGAKPLTLMPGELILGVRIAAQAEAMRCAYRKARVRAAMDFPLAGVAVRLVVEQGTCAELRVALTGTNSRPFVLEGTHALCRKPLTPELLGELGKLVQKQVSPMRTTVTSANYRRHVASVLAQRLVRELAGV